MFSPSPEVQDRLQILLARSRADDLTLTERAELDELERIEHVTVLLKTGALTALSVS